MGTRAPGSCHGLGYSVSGVMLPPIDANVTFIACRALVCAQVLIKVHYAGINRLDLLQTK